MQSILNASLFVSASGIMSLVAGFVSSVVIARVLGAEGTGLTALAVWVAITAAIISSTGVPAIVLRYISRQENTAEAQNGLVNLLYRRFLWPVLLASTLFLAYGVGDYFFEGLNNALVWGIAGLICFAYAQGHYVIAADHGLGHFHKTAHKTAWGCALQIPVTIAGAVFFGPAGAMAGYLCRYLPQAFGLSAYKHPSRTEGIEITPQMVRYGQSNWLTIVLDTLVKTRVEFLFIGFFFTVTEVGYFAVGVTFSSLILQLSLYLAAGLTPGFGKLHDDHAREDLQLSYDRALRWLSLLLVPVSLGGAAVMPALIPLAFGQDFAAAIPIGTLLVLFALPQALSAVMLSAMLAFEHDRPLLLINIVFAGILVILNLVLVPVYGGVGAAIVRGLIGVFAFAFMLTYCQKALGLSVNLVAMAKLLVSGVACAATASIIVFFIDGLPGLLLAIPGAAFVYLAFLRLIKPFPRNDLNALGRLISDKFPCRVQPVALRALAILR